MIASQILIKACNIATKSHQLKQFKILNHIRKSLNNISGSYSSNMRDFPKLKRYDNMSWFHDLPRITTNSFFAAYYTY